MAATTLTESQRKALEMLAKSDDWQSATTVHHNVRRRLVDDKLIAVSSRGGDERIRISARGRKLVAQVRA